MSDQQLIEALTGPGFIENPYPVYAALRNADPVFFVEPFNAWIVTRFEDVNTAFSDPRFQVLYEQHQTNRMGPTAVEQEYFKVGKEFLVVNDPPTHTRLKRIFRAPFTQNRVKPLVPMVEKLAQECIASLKDKGGADIVNDYAHEIPMCVISHLLNIPKEYEAKILEWMSAFYAVLFVSPMSDEELVSANKTAADAQQFFLDIVKERRANPGEDFITDLIQVNDSDEDPLEDRQIAINLFLLYFAGHDTQRGMFSNIISALDEHRDALAWLLEDTQRIDTAIHELYRYDATGQFMGRTAAEDLELGGKQIKAGQTLMVSMGAANRDPEAFPNPDKIDFFREAGSKLPYMTFGTGRHRCLGAALAQTNLPIMLKTLLNTMGEFNVDRARAERIQTMEVRGFHSLPISW